MDRYKVVKRIGVGTYGSAYLVCLKAMPSTQYVLKKVKVEQLDDKERLQAEQEVKVLMQLAHPLVLSYVDHFLYKGHLCIVTDYCDAGDLYQLLRARKTGMPEAQLIELFVQVVLAIQYVHQKNILHRDLKTQNIFLTSEGFIKLGDFGISRSLNSTVDLASTIIGTPYYMSPEVMSSMPYDFKSDMWSLGCVLYEMMSLKHAFDATDMSSLVMKILRGEHLPIPSQFSQDVRDLVRQLLHKNPKMRPSADQVLKMAFLKEPLARAKEAVASLEQRTAAARRASEGAAASSSGSYGGRQSYVNGFHSEPMLPVPVPGAGAGPVDPLDRELQAAKERLRRIQLEREALHKQVSYSPSGPSAPAQAAGGAAPAAGAAPGASPGAPPPPLPVHAFRERFPSYDGGAGRGPLLSQRSEPNLMSRHPALAAAEQQQQQQQYQLQQQPGGVGISGGGAAAQAGRGGGALQGRSWRDREEPVQRQLQFPSQQASAPKPGGAGAGAPPPPISGAAGQYAHLNGNGDVDAALERHREQRLRRSSRPQSPEVGVQGLGPGGGGAYSPQDLLDPKARMLRRKEAEARRRESELLNARKAYFEERKAAAAKLQQLYTPSPLLGPSSRRATESSGQGDGWSQQQQQGGGSQNGYNHAQALAQAQAQGLYGSPGAGEPSGGLSGGGSGYAYGSGNYSAMRQHHHLQQQQQQGGVYHQASGISSDDDSELDEPLSSSSAQQPYQHPVAQAQAHAHAQHSQQGMGPSPGPTSQGYAGDGALQEFEAELTSGYGGLNGGSNGYAGVSNHAFEAAAGLEERAGALRHICAENLGQPLYELIYGYVRKRMAQGVHDDPAFRAELLSRLGQSRMQYVHLIDQVIYYEDMQGLQGGLM